MKEPIDLRGLNFEEGYIAVLDKPLRWTSTDVVRKIKFTLRRLGYRKIKVGHAGTLDPLATGILLVCIGRATKMVDALQAEEKEYVADVMLGATTPSYDLEHPVDRTFPTEHIMREKVLAALSSLTGERLQEPPVYSAKKIDGTRAYELARAGEEVTMRKATVNIYELELLEYDLPRIRIRVRCSKGTYIRSLAHEIGQALESGPHLTSLRLTMKLSQYGYEFAPEMLAKHPTENRDDSRLMVINRAKGTVEHRIFKDIIEYFDEKDLFVFNDTKVFPARLYGNKEKTGAEIEIFLLRELNRELRLWDVLVDPARKIRIGNKLYFGDDDLLVAEVIDNTTSRGRTLRFLFDGSYEEFKQALFSLGETPLPKWVRDKVEPEDAERYQTIFARHEGAVAAPTAGMHFSKHLMKRMEIKGIDKSFITLHVGLGNFRTVDVEDLSKHKMDSEQFFVTDEAAEAVNSAKRDGHKIVAIGTTVMRTVETAVSTNGMIKPMEGWTNKFIFAPYEFTVADAMVTNFHLPYSTQLMMVAAFGGYETVMNAYKVAKEEGYRFGTYGDAMLIL